MTNNNSPKPRRFTNIMISGVLSSLLVAAAGLTFGTQVSSAQHEPAPVQQGDPVSVQEGAAVAELALGYSASASEDRIAQAQAQARNADNAEGYAALALAMLQRKRETSDAVYLHYAVDALDAAVRRDASSVSGHGRVLLVRILIAQDGHRFGEALALAKTMIKRRPADSIGHLLAGDALLELGDYAEAVDAYQTAVDMRPDLRSYNRAAHLRWLHGDRDGAIEALELALDAGSPRDPESMAWCFVDLGNIYLERGDAARATAAADRAQALVPGYVPAMIVRAHAQRLAGQRSAAIATLEAVVARVPHVEDLLTLSELYREAGRHGVADRRRAQAEKLAGGEPRPLAMFYARHNIELDRARELAQQELMQRQNIAAHDTQALVLIRLGQLDGRRSSARQGDGAGHRGRRAPSPPRDAARRARRASCRQGQPRAGAPHQSQRRSTSSQRRRQGGRVMRHLIAIPLLLSAMALLLIACNETPQAKLEPAAKPAQPTATASVDTRDQYALAHELVSAAKVDPDDDPDAYGRIVRSWEGKRYQWELAVIDVLCRRADSCVVAPFDHNRFEKRVVQGWLPRLELDAAAHAELQRQCQGKTRCIVRVDANMRALTASEAMPTSVTLNDVRILEARAPRQDESWVVTRRKS